MQIKGLMTSSTQLGRHLPNPFICLPDHAYEASLASIKMEGQNWPEKLLALGDLEPSMLPW